MVKTRLKLLAAATLSVLALAGPATAQTLSGRAVLSVADGAQPVGFDVYLPLRHVAALQTLLVDLQTPGSPTFHKWLTPAQFDARFGPGADAVAAVRAALGAQGFSVTKVVGRRIAVSGTAAQVNQAFATTLSNRVSGVTADVVAGAPLSLPPALKAAGVYIPSFSKAPPMAVASHMDPVAATTAATGERSGPAGPFWFDDLKQAYGFPAYQAYDGTGVNVAVLISGNALDSDIAAAFNHEQFTAVTGKPAPKLAARVDATGAPVAADAAPMGEASLDVQQVLGGAPGAAVTLVEIPTLTNADVLAGYTYIVSQTTASGAAKYSIVNSSFGGCDLYYTTGYPGAGEPYPYRLDEIFMQGNAEGITFVGSSGDEGALRCPDANYYAASPKGPSRFVASIELPSGSPHVTAVGGTNLLTSYSTPSGPATYVAESSNGDPETPYDPGSRGVKVAGGYWGAGGGPSALFARPSYQAMVATGSTTARTTPDVGMHVGGCFNNDPKFYQPCGPNRSHVWVVINGAYVSYIGTSIASPEFVGALALYVQKQGAGQGDINPYLYSQAAAQTAGGPVVFNRNIMGFDGKYANSYPGPAYNYMIGNGTPHVSQLFGLGASLAGDPQTPSNP